MFYYVWVSLLVTAMVLAWGSSLFALPGNWLIVGMGAVFAFFYPASEGRGLHWSTVIVAALLATVGEIIELLAGAAGAKRAGAGRRALLLSLVGTFLGSGLGAFFGVPIPIVGPIVGAVGGGALGAFLGAFLGETSRGRDAVSSLEVGRSAFVGRLIGTAGKLSVGVVVIVILAVDALF